MVVLRLVSGGVVSSVSAQAHRDVCSSCVVAGESRASAFGGTFFGENQILVQSSGSRLGRRKFGGARALADHVPKQSREGNLKDGVKKATSGSKKSSDGKEGKRKKRAVPDVEKIEEKKEKVYEWPPLVCCFGQALHEFLPSVRTSKKQMHPDIYSTWKTLQWSPPEFTRLPGSVPLNVAVALARLGGRVAFMGKVGDDEFGHDLVSKLITNGVQTRGVCFDPSLPTGITKLNLLHKPGIIRMSCVQPSAEDSFTQTDMNLDIMKEARVLQFTSISLTSKVLASALMEAIKLAQEYGADTYFDVNLPLPYWRSVELTRNMIKEVWRQSTIVEVTKHELEFILGEDYYVQKSKKKPQYFSTTIDELKNRRIYYHYEPEELAPLWHDKIKLIIVTDGTLKIHYYTPHFHGSVHGTEDALLAFDTCDRTGSGDAVTAALIRKLTIQPDILHDEDKLQKALRFVICAGIIAQWTTGAIRGMPTESAAQNLTEQVYPPAMVF